MIVIDASASIPWFLPDEFSPLADRASAYAAANGAVATWLWQLEIRNVLVMSVRRKRLSVEAVGDVVRLIPTLRIEIDRKLVPDEAFELALLRQISVYDATYLELARRRRLPLATLDARLARAAQAEGVELFI